MDVRQGEGRAAIRVVVAEDNPALREAIVKLLRRHAGEGIAVLAEAADGQEAIEKVMATHPDVLVIDAGLPRRSGWEVAQHIGHHAPETAVLLVSAEEVHLSPEDLKARGVSRFLVKSRLDAQLLKEIQACVQPQCKEGSEPSPGKEA